MDKPSLANTLTYAGALPFLACALLSFSYDQLPLLGASTSLVILTYGAVIASFIAGIHWGLYLFKNPPLNLFIYSNIITLAAWANLYFVPTLGAIILIICFAILLVIDRQLAENNIIEDWFYSLRIRISTIVIGALIVFLFSRFI